MIAGKFSFSTLCLEHLFASRGETRKEGQNGEKRGTSFARMRNRQTNWKIRLSGAERIRGNACHGDLIARWPRNFVRNVPPAVPHILSLSRRLSLSLSLSLSAPHPFSAAACVSSSHPLPSFVLFPLSPSVLLDVASRSSAVL